MTVKRHPNLTPELRGEAIAAYQRCRALRSHAWDPIPSDYTPLYGEAYQLRCLSCGTVRTDIFSRHSGERIGRPVYDYPPDYRDADSHPQAWWRATWADTLAANATGIIRSSQSAPATVTPIRKRRRAPA